MHTVTQNRKLITHRAFSVVGSLALAALVSACVSGGQRTSEPLNDQYKVVKRNMISAQECLNAGGELVGDIGDGRIHKSDYLCNNGTAPIGTIKAQDEPVMTEGAVCCGP